MDDENEIKENNKNNDNIGINKEIKKKSKKNKNSKSKNKIHLQDESKNIIINNEIDEPIELIQLKEEIRKKEKKLKKLDPLHFEFINNLEKSENNFRVDNTFEIFNSVQGYICLVYAYRLLDKYNSIATYNIIDNKTICLMKNVHNEDITNFRHYLDKNKNRDLILSISATDNNVKMWDFNNMEYLLTIKNINRHGFIKSACILNFNHNLYIATSNYSYSEIPEPIRLYNLEGYKIKEINYKNNQTFFIDIYNDRQFDIVYIITGNFGFVRTYNYTNDCKYHRYNDGNEYYEHYKVIIYNKSNEPKIIAAGKERVVLIWDFHSTELLNKIKISDVNYDNIYGICLWNKKFLFVGCGKTLNVIDIENETVVNTLNGHGNNIITIKTVIHPRYGECVISQELYTGQMKLWANQVNKINSIINSLYEKIKLY